MAIQQERVDYRTPTQEADTPIIGAFGGLSSATVSTTGNITHAQKLVNAYVNKRNEIVRRQGSSIILGVQNQTNAAADAVSFHKFRFDERDYICVREGYNLRLVVLNSSGQVLGSLLKTNVYNTSASIEPTSFTVVIEDDVCYVIGASKSSPPNALVIIKRDAYVSTQTSPTIFAVGVNAYPAGNVVNANKFLLYDSTNEYLPLTSVSQSNFLFSCVSTAPLITPANENLKAHLVFSCNCASAAYYPGLYLYNTAIRRNLVPLDVNVLVPQELAANPIVNEPSIQNLDIQTIRAYKTNSPTATIYNRIYTRQPNTVDDFDFSDGSYRVGTGLFTVRTPLYIAFGALQTPSDDTRVFMFRSRTTATVLPTYRAIRSRISVFVDKVLTTVATYDQTGASVTDDIGESFYYTLATNTSPGINLSAVVELVYRLFSPNQPIVDLTDTLVAITIDDNYVIPLYGLSAISNVGSGVFPSIVQTVGNRVVLTGFSNRIGVSDANWSYRGISWNNFQVSTINFGATSAYLLSLTQSTSVVRAVLSVNGVIIVGTDSGIYRVSGSAANSPPNATSANVSRVSNELVAGQSAMTIYGSKVWYVSRNGLYSLEFSRDNEEVNAEPLSTQVSNYFTEFTADAITYSELYRGFLISFRETKDVLVFFIESNSFAVFRIASPISPLVTPTIDGYKTKVPTTTPGLFHVLLCRWDSNTTDFSNAATALPPASQLLGTSQTFTEVSQDNQLVTPAELLDTLNPLLRQSYGKDKARAITGTVDVAETIVTNAPTPIISALVTKAFSQSKLISGNRIRAINFLVKGSGAAKAKIIYQNVDYNDRETEITNVAIDSNAGYQGESLLNYAYVEQAPVGDNVNVRLRFFGNSEAWEAALVWDGTLSILGYQFDTSAKSRGRLR